MIFQKKLACKKRESRVSKAPHEWFKNPGRKIQPYSEQDLKERLLIWDDLQPGNFGKMIEARSKRIIKKAESILGYAESNINALFEGE